MRISVDITVLQQDVTGVGRVLLGLYNACLGLWPSIDVTGFHRMPLQCGLPQGMKDSLLAPWLPGRIWRSAIPFYCSFNKSDFVHFPWNGGVINPPGKCKTVITLHDLIPLALPHLYFKSAAGQRAFRSRIQSDLNKAHLIITDSENSKQDILHFLKPNNEPVVVYPGFSPPEKTVRGASRDETSEPYFLYYGGYERRKGLDQLVRIYHEMFSERLVTCPLIVLGTPNYFDESFRLSMKKAVESGSVIEKGYVGDEKLISLLRGARALVYPSLYEGFGYPPLEAMAVGCPVITSRAGSLQEVCGEAAVYVSPGNDSELSSAIHEMAGNNELRACHISLGAKQADIFTWERSALTYLKALDSMIS